MRVLGALLHRARLAAAGLGLGSLAIATVIYILVAVAAVGALPAPQPAGDDAPLATALSEGQGIGWGADVVAFGALAAITSVVLTFLYGQTRIAYSMCCDGLLPERLASIWEGTRTPVVLTALFANRSPPSRLSFPRAALCVYLMTKLDTATSGCTRPTDIGARSCAGPARYSSATAARAACSPERIAPSM